MVSVDYLRVLRVTRVPASVRHNPDALMCLFSFLGPVQHVAVASDDSGEAFVFFTTVACASGCLERVAATRAVTSEREGTVHKLCVQNFAVPVEVLSTVPPLVETQDPKVIDDMHPAVQREGRLQVGNFDVTIEGVLLRAQPIVIPIPAPVPTLPVPQNIVVAPPAAISAPPAPVRIPMMPAALPVKRPRESEDGDSQKRPPPPVNNVVVPQMNNTSHVVANDRSGSADDDATTPLGVGAILVLAITPTETPNNSKIRPMTCMMALHLLTPIIRPRAVLVCFPTNNKITTRTVLAEYPQWSDVDRLVELLNHKMVDYVDPDDTVAYRFRVRAQRGTQTRPGLRIPHNNDLQVLLTNRALELNGGILTQHWSTLPECNRVANAAAATANVIREVPMSDSARRGGARVLPTMVRGGRPPLIRSRK